MHICLFPFCTARIYWKFTRQDVYTSCFVQKMLRTTRAYALKTSAFFIYIPVFASVLLLFLLHFSLSRSASLSPPRWRRFLGVSVAGNRRNRFFGSSPRRAISLSLSPARSLSFSPCFFPPFFPHPVRFRQSDAVLRREPGNDRWNSAIIAGAFASTLQTQTDAIPRPNGCILIPRPSETPLADSIPGFSRCSLFSHRYPRGFLPLWAPYFPRFSKARDIRKLNQPPIILRSISKFAK